MRFATIRTASGTQAVRDEGDQLVGLNFADVGELLAAGDLGRTAREESGATFSKQGADFATLVSRPSKIICVGLNYRSHILERGQELPNFPTLFAKFTSALIGANDAIVLPKNSSCPDWEVELGVVIGKPARHVDAKGARAAIGGLCTLNDVTMRDWQRRTLQWLQGKTFEKTTPVGPFLVTPDEVDYGLDLEVRCEIDDRVMQIDRTSELVFNPIDIVSYISEITTLMPGDIIATGTTGGVGDAQVPPHYLAPGTKVRTVVEGLGECINICVAE
ncbi:MAG TPA: fumarylacetoacetate hydrolase family protein [Acidimicrobiales bacterium]|nr:fumarylacetoacetate hydrolase family protein [Acidimicrobiales bacterium]